MNGIKKKNPRDLMKKIMPKDNTVNQTLLKSINSNPE